MYIAVKDCLRAAGTHMGSHMFSCHPTEATSRHYPFETGTGFIDTGRTKGSVGVNNLLEDITRGYYAMIRVQRFGLSRSRAIKQATQ